MCKAKLTRQKTSNIVEVSYCRILHVSADDDLKFVGDVDEDGRAVTMMMMMMRRRKTNPKTGKHALCLRNRHAHGHVTSALKFTGKVLHGSP